MRFNHILPYAGKLTFVAFDILAMVALTLISRSKYRAPVLKLYSYNPLFIYLTVRGSCESISLALMYLTFYFVFGKNGNIVFESVLNKKARCEDLRRWSWLGYMLYGLWVHMRVYPIILLPVILVHEYKLAEKAKASFFKKFVVISFFAGGTFTSLFLIFYYLYGYEFLQETFLYHVSRLDNRHSLSPIFYEIYLSLNTQSAMRSLAQFAVFMFTTRRVHQTLSPYYAHFLITYAFVSFNKVITMQYYMWIFGALILVTPESTFLSSPHRRFQKSFGYIMQWVLGISLWVWLSMRLEKDGENVYNMMWFICVAKLLVDLWVVVGFMGTVVNKQSYCAVEGEEESSGEVKKSE
jgi:phosphatidylinositol glycan class M